MGKGGAASRPPAPDPGDASAILRSSVWRAIVVCGVIGVVVSGFYLSVYALRDHAAPVGWDTATYLWRSQCVEEGGLDALKRCVPHEGRSLPSRIGYPVVALPISSALPISLYEFAAVLPPVLAAAVALAGATLVSKATEAGMVVLAVVAVVVGASPMVVQLTGFYADNLLALAIALAALLFLVVSVAHRVGSVAAAALFALAAVVHWPTAAVLGAALIGSLVASRLVDRDRVGESDDHVIVSRVATFLGAGFALWAATLVALVRAEPEMFSSDPEDFARKLRDALPAYGLPVSVPAAFLGGYALARRPRGRLGRTERFLLGLFVAWVLVVVVGLVMWIGGLRSYPPNRLLVLALPLPMLGALGLLWVADRWDRRVAGAGAATIALGIAAVFAVGYVIWLEIGVPKLRPTMLAEASTAGAYLEFAVPEDRPVVIPVRGSGVTAAEQRQHLLVALPPERIETVRMPGEDDVDDGHGPAPVLHLRSFSSAFDRLVLRHPENVVAADLVVLGGPIPARDVTGSPPRFGVGYPALQVMAVVTLVLLTAAGFGWTWAAAGSRIGIVGRLAVSPAVGVAAVASTGLVADMLGVPLTGAGGVGVMLVAVASGIVAAYVVRR